MMSRDLAAALAVAAAAWGCAHAQPDPYVEQGVASMRTWLDGIPRCAPSQLKVQTASLGAAGADPADAAIIAVRGRLTLATNRICTAAGCGEGCCNRCWPAWVVIPDGGDHAGRELGIERPNDPHELSAVVMQCKLDEIRRRLPPTQVLVTGFIERGQMRDHLADASLCVIPPPPAPPP
jgi:hypothetical protein